MKQFLYQAQITDRGNMRLELGSFNICRNINISKTFTMKIIKKRRYIEENRQCQNLHDCSS